MPAKRTKASTSSASAKRGVERGELLETLQARFRKHVHRHAGLEWEAVEARLEARPAAARGFRALLEV